MQTPSPESRKFSGKLSPAAFNGWLDDTHILDTDHFLDTLSLLQRNGVHPDLIASVITHFASKWLPDLTDPAMSTFNTSPESLSSIWTKKRLFIETLVRVLPEEDEKSAVPCDFLLRLLRAANMVGAGHACCAKLEERISRRLDQASVTELMIPAFSHDCDTLFDVELVLRLVRGFVGSEEGAKSAALVKVGKLVDCFLAEAAVDAHFKLLEFVALADAVPSHVRLTDDGLYRAVDTYLKVHPSLSKQERKTLCNLIHARKLSTEASLHAAQNQRLPVRTIIQVLLAEQTKLGKCVDWSGSQSCTRSPGFGLDHPARTRSPGFGLDHPARCMSSKREYAQQMEVKRLMEDVARLQSQCISMERQIERVAKNRNRKKNKGYFGWKKIRFSVFGIVKVGNEN